VSGWKLLLLGLFGLVIKAVLAMVPPVAGLADPLLVIAVFAALPGRRWTALWVGLVTGLLDDALFGQWLGLHAFSHMTIAFSLALIAARMDMVQPFPALFALAGAALADWGIQVGLAVLFNRSADAVPGVWIWTGAVLVNTMLGVLFFRLVARRGTLS
jgi:rod shape-determining protein MreD